MELPKIKKENLTPELREVVGDTGIEFESVGDPTDVMNLPYDPKKYQEDRLQTARMLVESRKKLDELMRKNK